MGNFGSMGGLSRMLPVKASTKYLILADAEKGTAEIITFQKLCTAVTQKQIERFRTAAAQVAGRSIGHSAMSGLKRK